MSSSSQSIYSLEQQKTLFWITKFPALCSIVCSYSVIYHLRLDKRNRLRKLYGRLWFLISLTNILVAFVSMIASLATPRDTGVYGAFGTEASCQAMGATFMFFFVICMGYNASLAVMFFMSIHTKWTERDFTKKVEPWLHIVPFVYATAGVTVGLTTHMFSTHDFFLYCWAAPSPFGCRFDGDEGASCQYGNYLRDAFVFLGGLVEMNLLTSVKIITTFTLYRTVLLQEKKMQAKYHAKSSGNTIAKETGIQAILFFLSCVAPYGLMILLRIIDLYFWETATEPGFFWYSLVSQILFPCQGCMNMICYFRPKIKERQRKLGGEESIFHSLLVLLEMRESGGKSSSNPYAAPGGTYGGQSTATTSISTSIRKSNINVITNETVNSDKSDVENATGNTNNTADGDCDPNHVDDELDLRSVDSVDEVEDIGYLDVEELEKAVGHTFALGEEMIGDTQNRILLAMERKQRSSDMGLIHHRRSGKSKQRHSGQISDQTKERLSDGESAPSVTEQMETRSDDSSSVISTKRIDMSGEVS